MGSSTVPYRELLDRPAQIGPKRVLQSAWHGFRLREWLILMSLERAYRRAARRAKTPGFTLVELMIVVAIVGVLGALATYSVTKYIQSTKTSEASGVINSIRGAQEMYRQDTFVYLDVSEGSFGNLHPSKKPGSFKRSWKGDGDNAETSRRFRELGVTVDAPLYYTYGAVAGKTGDSFPTPPTDKKAFGLPSTATEPFYVIVAKGDVDGDGTFSYLLTHSLTNEVYIENEGE